MSPVGQTTSKPRLSAIAAISKNRVIGHNGQLPWHIPKDLQRVRTLTLHHPIIMGRKTFESIGRPLPKRHNIVITRQPDYSVAGILVAHSINQALDLAKTLDTQEIFIFGGGEIYAATLPLVERLYLTIVEVDLVGDTFFPDYSKFSKVLRQETHEENGYRFQFLDLERE